MASGPGTPPSPRRRAYRWVLWLAGGCLVSTLLATAALGFTIGTLIGSGIRCVPADFPDYPLAIPGGSTLGSTGCRLTHLTLDRTSQVLDFYASRLNGGSWAVTATYPTIRVDFEHVRGTKVCGSVWTVDQGPFRAICVLFRSSPSAEGATPPARTPSLLQSTAARRPVCAGQVPQPS